MSHSTSSSAPKYQLVQQQVLDWIRNGKYVPGDRLPGEQAIAVQLGLNHLTVRRGLEDLAEAGVIEKRPRVGNFVKATRARELAIHVALVCPRHLLEPSGQHPMIGPLVSGLCCELDHRDYAISTLSYGPDRLWDDVGPTVIERGMRGIVLYPQYGLSVDQVCRFEDEGIRVVLAGVPWDNSYDGVVSGAVTVSSLPVLEQAAERLIELGHRRIAGVFFTGSPYRRKYEAVFQRFCDAHPKIGTLDEVMFYIPNRDTDFARIERLFDRHPAPTAFIVNDEYMASELFRIAYRRKLSVPRDFSIVSLHNNTPHAFPVAIASPDTPHYVRQMGELAAQRLAKVIEGESPDQPFLRIDEQLHWGESIAPPSI